MRRAACSRRRGAAEKRVERESPVGAGAGAEIGIAEVEAVGAVAAASLARSLLAILASAEALNVPALVQMSRTLRTFSCGGRKRESEGFGQMAVLEQGMVEPIRAIPARICRTKRFEGTPAQQQRTSQTEQPLLSCSI